MPEHAVGLGDIALHVPSPRLDLDILLKQRASEDPTIERKLARAISSTGQKSLRFPDTWEDTATLAAQSMWNLDGGGRTSDGNAEQDRAVDYSRLRYLAVGTESSVDHSKPVSAYVQGMMQSAGANIPDTISTFQVQHACAGGTIGMLSVGALLCASPEPQETGVVICSDIARYDAPSNAEPTQGAGAVSLFIEKNPRLLEIDIGTAGYASHDVDDFFRPLGSDTARVKGGYSIQCYNESLETAFQDHCRRVAESPSSILRKTDLFAFHVPFHEMAILAAHKLIGRHLNLSGSSLADFLAERGFLNSLEPLRSIGNVYTGSAYLVLAFLLAERYRTLGDAIVGKRLLLASYGSGNTMIVLSGRVAARAPEVVTKWNLDAIWRDERAAEWNDYLRWISGTRESPTSGAIIDAKRVPANRFYLSGIREDGYRQYEFCRG